MATVFVGTLLTYLVVTAVPAMAVSTCSNVADADVLVVNIDVDDDVALRDVAGVFQFSINGAAFAPCLGTATDADVDVIQVTGTNAGVESFILLEPGEILDFSNNNVIVNLGNGNDSLVLEMGDAPGQPGSDPFPGVAEAIALGTSANGTLVGTADNAANAPPFEETYLRIDNAENITVNADPGVTNDLLDLDGNGGAAASAVNAVEAGTADDVPAMVAGNAFPQGVTFNAGQGEDTLVSGDGADIFNGGPGTDLVDYIGASAGVTADLGAAAGTGQGNDVLSDVQNVNGSQFNDIIRGSTLDNVLDGRDGNDDIDGLAGNDTVLGGDDGPDADSSGGNDTLRGGPGIDTVNGEDGDDIIDEEAAANGADTLIGGSGNEVVGDTLDHSARTVSVAVTAGAGGANDGADLNGDGDSLDAGEEGDTVDATFEIYLGGTAADTYVGHGGAETFVPGLGNDNVNGGAGVDLLDVSASTTAATINIETGTATSDQGTDTFAAIEQFATGTGDDVLIPDVQTGLPPIATFDWFADGGIDTVDGSTNTGGFAVDLSILGDPGTGPGGGCSGIPSPSVQDAGGGSCTIVENATGGSGNDTLIGSPASNVLLGGDGIDAINGDAGNDLVEGGAGNDNLSGGTGADTLSYVNAPSGEVIDLQLGFASGGDGDDAIGFFEIVFGSDFRDTITGGSGTTFDVNLRIRGRGGNDLITGSSSNDTLAGNRGRDVIRAGGGDDNVRLGGGNDVGAGGSGDDVLRGASGNDRLLGGSGDDFLFGGRGNDVGRGGGGDDTCRTEVRRSC